MDQDKVFIFDYVPQLSVLDHCSIFISHGGLNSVKESIYKNVPLLTFPLNQDWDHNGNSARVTYHQIGMKGNIQETDSISIKHQLVYLLENEEFFKENLEKLKMADRYYDEIYFLDTFNQLVGG